MSFAEVRIPGDGVRAFSRGAMISLAHVDYPHGSTRIWLRPLERLEAVSMYMKDRKAFESDETYLAYCWSLKPDDWTDEDWQEYLEWRQSLPDYDTRPDIAHLVIVGKKEKPSDD